MAGAIFVIAATVITLVFNKPLIDGMTPGGQFLKIFRGGPA